jgi:uncharacterized protein
MKIAGTFSFKAGQIAVWDTFMNPDSIAKALPGVERLIPIEGEIDAWRATAKIGIAAVSGTYTGIVRMSDIAPHDHFLLSVDGEGQGSIIGAAVQVALSYDTTKGITSIAWDADANVFGRLAGLGQRLVAAAASMLAQQFFRSLARQIPGEATKSAPSVSKEEHTQQTKPNSPD